MPDNKCKPKGRKTRPKLSTPANSRRVFQLLHDEAQTEAGREELATWFDQLINDAGPDTASAPIFDLTYPFACREVERGRHDGRPMGARQAYRALQDILTRTAKGETLDQIAQEREAAIRARTAELKREQLNAPEPKDKLSAEWRYWQIAQISHALNERTEPGYSAAWRKVESLIKGLVNDENFWRADLILPMLGHLFSARQEIDELVQRERRDEAHVKAWKTRRAKQAQKGGGR